MRGRFPFGEHHTLVIYAPDDGPEKGWTVRVEGTPDPADAEIGRSWQYGTDDNVLCSEIKTYLCRIVPSEVVDENWKKLKKWIKDVFWGYQAVGPMSRSSD